MCLEIKVTNMRSYLQLLGVICLGACIYAQINSDGPLIKIPQGLIQGNYKKSYRNRTFSAFEGIPYAKPPIDDLRFQEPQPADIWKNTLVANKHYECMQFIPFSIFYGPRGTEDCLYMYVYVPRKDINPNELLNVVVYIHGGGFMLGSPKFLAGPQFIMDQDVIYVTFNYRLNIIGFLSTEDEVVPGNNGLKDQALALEWIKENIKFFGGNPASITLTGTSAGAASVHYHYLSPLSKGLFHRGFSQSGTALQCWALIENPLERAKTVARNLTCPTTSTSSMIDCLRKIDANELMNATSSLYKYISGIPFVTFGPVIEKDSEMAFLSEHPYRLMKKGDVYDVPWITSNTKDEGLFPVRFAVWMKKIQVLEEKWNDIMPYALDLDNTLEASSQQDVLSKIKNFYFKQEPVSERNLYSLVELFSDRMFLVDVEKAVKLHASAVKSEVYHYLFSYILEMPSFPSGDLKGASHGDDAKLIFGMIGTPQILSDNDEKMMSSFIEFIADYANTGVPTLNKTEWIPQGQQNNKLNSLSILSAEEIEMTSVDKLGASDFWDALPLLELERALSCSALLKSSLILNVCFVIVFYVV